MSQFSDEKQWISAREAINLLSPTFGGDGNAKVLVADRLKDGQLQARARCCAIGRDMGRVSATIPEQSEAMIGTGYAKDVVGTNSLKGVVLTSAFWSWSTAWEADQKRWQWGPGVFVVSAKTPPVVRKSAGGAVETAYSEPSKRMVAYGVEFMSAEIDAIVGRKAASLPAKHEPRTAPKRVGPRLWDWEPALIELMMIADLDGLDARFGALTARGNQKKLEQWFAAWFQTHHSDEPSPAEIRKRAQLIVGALRQRGAGLHCE